MRERNLNADLIRCVAVFSVVSVHFLLNTGFYGITVVGKKMLAMCMFRSFFMTCVPMFLVLTGYLMNQKTLSRRYYKGILKTLEIYVLASIACLLYKKYVMGNTVTLQTAILDILNYKGANYAWYVEMYIGLFFMIPFLNLAYHGLKSKREKQILVLTMISLTMLPKILNNFNLVTEGWWLLPSSSKDYNKLVPGFFTSLYPVTYYFIGAYLREYDIKIKKKLNLLLLILAVAVFGTYNFYRSYGVDVIWGSTCSWGGENLITTVLLFVLLLHVKIDKWPSIIKKALVYLSGISFGLYLVSWIADQIVYHGFLEVYVPEAGDRLYYFPIVIPCVFLLSALGSSILYLVRSVAGKAIPSIVHLTKKSL